MSHKVKFYSLWVGAASLAVILLFFAFKFDNGKQPTTISNSHFGSITSIDLLPNDYHFVSAAFDYKVKFWDLMDEKHLKTMDSNLHVIKNFATSKTKNLIYGVGNEGTFHLWDSDTFNSIKKFDPLYFPIEEIILSENEDYLAAKTKDLVIVFNILSDTELSQPLFLDEEIHKEVQSFFFNDHYLISVGSEGNIHFWDYRSGKLKNTIDTGYSIQRADLSNDGKKIVVGYKDPLFETVSVLELWNLEQKIRKYTLGKCDGNVLDILTRSFTDKAVVSCSQSPLYSFNFDTSQAANKLWNEIKPGVRDLTYSHKQDALLYRFSDNIEIIWNFKNSI